MLCFSVNIHVCPFGLTGRMRARGLEGKEKSEKVSFFGSSEKFVLRVV
jgi:hypothetical protein